MFKLTAIQQVSCAITYVDAHGNPAPVEGPPSWSSSDESVIALDVADDGMSALVKAAGPIGQAQVSVMADARFGPQVVAVVAIETFEVIAAEAVAGVITPGTPETQP